MKKTTLSLLVFSFILITAHAQTTRYVKPTASGTGDGLSWANASADLQFMINASDSGNQVWVAAGTYLPQHSPVDGASFADQGRDNAFLLKKDVKVYGGFSGTESNLTERDSTLQSNQTILSGDIGTVNVSTDNTYHVVVSAGAVGTAELNSFLIEKGNANVSVTIQVNSINIYQNYGGGITIYTSSPILSNLTISRNTASHNGGGIDIFNPSAITNVTISNVTISGNTANFGGGIDNESSSSILTNVTISGNTATWDGGGIYNLISSPILTNVTISGNTATSDGGGIFNTNTCSPILTNVTISGNSASNGGGIYNEFSSNPQIRNSIIYGNSNGIDNDGSSTPTINYSLVQGLTATTNNNISGSTDPQFVSPVSYTSAPTTTGDYRLSSTSPTIGAGDSTYYNVGQTPDLSAITTDRDGYERIFGTQIDMGPYEYGSVVPLPITLIQFSAIAEGQKAKLEWTTATEKNNREFVISRSSDGKNFKEIGEVSANNQAAGIQDYVYYDEQPQNGKNFYRLQQVDFDGKTTLSGIRMVQFSIGQDALSIFPNPVTNALEVTFAAGSFQTLELCDIMGKTLQTQKITSLESSLNLNFKSLPAGVYFLRMTGNGNIVVRKIVHE